MKNHLLCAWTFSALIFTAPLLLAQSGVVNYNTGGAPADKRIYLADWSYPGGGGIASGPEYQTALWWGPAGTIDDGNMVQVGPSIGFLTGAAAGTFFGSGRTITGLPANGAVVSLQSRAWLAAGATGYADARGNGKGPGV